MSGTGTRPVGRGPARRRSGARAAKDEERPRLEEPVLAALRWLARHQHPDGSWSVTAFSENCGRHGLRGDCTENAFQGNDQFEVGVTALALLAILGAGYLPSSDEAVVPASEEMNELSAALGTGRPLTWGLVARRAVKRLLKAQAPSGMVGPEVDRAIYNHLLATLALCEAYALTRTPALEEPAQRAADFTAAYRRAAQGWRYAPQAAETDSSVTGWAVLALQSARAAGLAVDRAFEDEVRRWFEAATVEAVVEPRLLGGDPSGDGSRDITGAQKQPRWLLTGYLGPADAGKLVSVPGLNDSYFYTPASTASRILVEALLTGKEGTAWPGGEKAVETLLAFPPARFSVRDRSTWRQADFYYWYHGTAALALAAGKDHPAWSRWNEALRPALLESQLLEETRGTCREGSWEPVDRWSCEGGRVYATALNALTLEAHYRYPRLPARPKPEVALRLEGR